MLEKFFNYLPYALFAGAFLGIFVTGQVGLGILCLLLGFIFMKVSRGLAEDKKQQEVKERQQEEEKKAREAKEQMRIKQLNQQVKDGVWAFPSGKFYQLCRDSHVTSLDNEFAMRKATQIAKQVIKEAAPDIKLENCGEYLRKESLEGFLKKRKTITEKIEASKLLEQKRPRNANPTKSESTFIRRTSQLRGLYGSKKRIKMLTNLLSDYDAKIKALREGEEALALLGTIYADQQKKETSWAVMGGIADGIAGPGAGIMAAQNTIANNQKIRQHNESVRKASMEIMSGIPGVAGNRYQLEEEREQIRQKLNEANGKIVLSKPVAEEIWDNIEVGKAVVEKNPSGVLSVSVPVSLKKPFALDVPDGVQMVVDGVIHAGVWFEDERVGGVSFPLPIYGIPHNMTSRIILDGMCGQSVEYDGEYTVRIGDRHDLWIMEA